MVETKTKENKITITLVKGHVPEFKFFGDWVGSDIRLVRGFMGRSYRKWKETIRKKGDKNV